ncbi:hypothetical protein AVEN_201042-1, partial [Araneus ventricosus]
MQMTLARTGSMADGKMASAYYILKKFLEFRISPRYNHRSDSQR